MPIERAHEKLGNASLSRGGSGPLVWFHAASVGESLSVLSLISAMARAMPRVQFLITTGTVASAKLVATRLPERTQHQFAPLDSPGPVKRFLAHWRPDAAIFVESELWPQMLWATRCRGTQIALVNARLSEASKRAWCRRPATARFVFECFDLILTQNDEMAEVLVALNAPSERVARGTNLKGVSDPLPQDPIALAQVRASLQGKPVWVAASTHAGEEQTVLEAHQALRLQHTDLVLVLAPRHPDRSAEIEELFTSAGLSVAVRSKGERVSDQAIYLADTLGELGNWYALSKVVFLGGSLVDAGGHNPFEVIQTDAAVLSGPHIENFSETFADLRASGAAQTVNDAASLAAAIDLFLTDDFALEEACRAARDYVRTKSTKIEDVSERLIAALGLQEHKT